MPSLPTIPGSIVFPRTPERAHSAASDCSRSWAPAFPAPEWSWYGAPRTESVAPIERMAPPLSISVLVVPFVVAAGFALAIGIHVYTQLPMLTSAGLLAGALLPVVIFYDRVVATV